MRFIFYHITCFLILAFLYSGNVNGQIFKTNADTVIKITPDTSIHVFYTHITGSLLARPPQAGAATFQWSVYDAINHNFNQSLSVTDSMITNLTNGGYQVRITVGGIPFVYVAWVFVDTLKVKFEKDTEGNIMYNRYTCDYTDLKTTWSQSTFIYFNAKKEKQILPTPTFIWESNSSPAINISTVTSSLRLDTTKKMPYEKATFYVHLKDKFGASSQKDFAYYTPIVTKAIIDTTNGYPHPTHIEVRDGKDVEVQEPKINSAPFTLTFLNKSKNGVSYVWKFPLPLNDTVKKKDTTSITRVFDLTSPNDTTPYKIYLISQSLQRCVDTTSINILVSQGEVGRDKSTDNPWPDLPNVFTPDGYGGNEIFKFYNISILHFRITIFSRWGKPVYQKEGSNMLEWEGWNGKINNTGPEASEGIYYYVLEVISYDKNPDQTKMNPAGKYHGFFYLFRKK